MTDTSRNLSLVVRRRIPASPAAVFSAWTDADQLVKWWGPPGVECAGAEVDLRIGGGFKLGNRLPGGEVMWISGHYEVVDPPRQLIHTWTTGPDASSAIERVTVDFLAIDGGTEVTVTHRQIGSEEARIGHEGGWVGCLDGLVELLGQGRSET